MKQRLIMWVTLLLWLLWCIWKAPEAFGQTYTFPDSIKGISVTVRGTWDEPVWSSVRLNGKDYPQLVKNIFAQNFTIDQLADTNRIDANVRDSSGNWSKYCPPVTVIITHEPVIPDTTPPSEPSGISIVPIVGGWIKGICVLSTDDRFKITFSKSNELKVVKTLLTLDRIFDSVKGITIRPNLSGDNIGSTWIEFESDYPLILTGDIDPNRGTFVCQVGITLSDGRKLSGEFKQIGSEWICRIEF